MPIFQGRLITCLILSAFSATTWADSVLVNTTADITADDTSCSIREAISYLNSKNSKKATIDEEIAIISGSSLTFIVETNQVTAELKAEKAKAIPNLAEIARLEAKLKASNDKFGLIDTCVMSECIKKTPKAALKTGSINNNLKIYF